MQQRSILGASSICAWAFAVAACSPTVSHTQIVTVQPQLVAAQSPVVAAQTEIVSAHAEIVAAKDMLAEEIPTEIRGSKIARLWRFDDDGDSEGWRPFQSIAPLEVAGGRLVIRNVAFDPYLVGPELCADASEYQFLALRVRSTADGLTQFFYSKRDQPGFREAQMIAVPMKGDGESHFYEVDLRPIRNWSGPLENLRIDPVNGLCEVGATVEIEWIALYQSPAEIEALLPYWKEDDRLVIGFENRGGQNADAPIELHIDGVLVGEIACLDSPGRGSVEIDARAQAEEFWLEATLAGERIWRGRMRKPVEPSAGVPRGHVAADEIEARAHIVVGSGAAVLAVGAAKRRVRLAPIASLTLRGPGRANTYYEFDVEPRDPSDARPGAPHLYEEWVDDPLVGTLLCTTTVAGSTVRTALECSAPIEVLRFEGPRMLELEQHTHAIFPGLEYLEAGESSSSADWTGPGEAERSTPEPHKITVPMIAVEYGRAPAGKRRGIVARTIEATANRDAPVPSAATTLERLRSVADPDDSVGPGDGARAGVARGNRAGAARGNEERPRPPEHASRTTDVADESAWVAGLIWDIDNRRGVSPSAPTAEFVSQRDGLSYATAYLPSMPDVHENRRYASAAYELAAHERLELETRYVLEPGTIEEAYERHWTHAVAPPPTLAWAADDERIQAEQRSGPGSRAAIERIVEISMLAYTKTLFSLEAPGWKTHIAVGEPYAQRRLPGALVLAESLRSERKEYADAIGLEPGGQIEDWLGTATSFVDDAKRRDAWEIVGRVGHDGGIGYDLKPALKQKIEEFTAFYGLHYDDFGVPGETNAGYTAIQVEPLLEYAACTLDPIFVAAAERVIAKINSFTVPRGAQTWEIHMQTPDLYAAAQSSLCNVWGYRMTGDERYLDEAQRWIRTGIPFLYLWEPPIERHVRSVHVNDGDGEGNVLAERDPHLFYEDVERQINPYASIPVFGTSWYAVTWLGIPVQWCGLAWGNAVREIDAIRPMPNLVDVADGVFRSGANQQSDKGYLAGTLPDSWDVASALSRQPFIIPERILEYAYRVLGVPYLDTLQYVRLEGPRWNHIASRALLTHARTGEREADGVTFDARFFAGQNASVLVGGRGAPLTVRVNGRELENGAELWNAHWLDWEEGRGALVVRWVATGGDDRIEILDR